ncbi:MAG: acyl carrier protein [Tissierellia bacterium]|nr:acyl carrier protein [Bacillota bacterium]NLL22538.1 acyl carrier protein [Tissierellia bacterium]
MMKIVLEILEEYVDFDPKEVNEDTNLLTDLNMTSYDRISLLGAVEKRFGIEVSEDEAVSLTTIGEIVKLLEEIVK